MPEEHYRLRNPTLGVSPKHGEKGFILVPAGSIITLIGPCLQGGPVEARWDEKQLFLIGFAKNVMDWKNDRYFTWQTAGFIADLIHELDEARRHATEAISRYNKHIGICNRVADTGIAGDPVDTSTIIELRSQVAKRDSAIADKESEIGRLKSELARKQELTDDISARWNRLSENAPTSSGKPGTEEQDAVISELINKCNRLTQQLAHSRSQARADGRTTE